MARKSLAGTITTLGPERERDRRIPCASAYRAQAKLFLVFRQQLTPMQAALSEKADFVSSHMVHCARQLTSEGIFTVRGTVERHLTLV